MEWREPGCSMCLAMNADRLLPGERCASTSIATLRADKAVAAGRTGQPSYGGGCSGGGPFCAGGNGWLCSSGGRLMKPFTVHSGLVAPMDRANVDTDLMIPKQFLKSIKRSGFARIYLMSSDIWMRGSPRG